MADTAKVKIKKISRKSMPSKFKEGETYDITTFLDEITGRKGSTTDQKAKTWKEGDEIEGTWEKSKWTDKDGFEQEQWKFKLPGSGQRGAGGSWGPRKATLVDAYTIAAILSPVLYKDKKSLKFDDIAKLAEEVMKRLEVAPAAAPAEKVKNVDLDAEESGKTAKTKAKKGDDDFDVDEEEESSDSSEKSSGDDDIF